MGNGRGRAAHQSLRFKLVTALLRRVPPLKYWGLRRSYLTRTGWVRSNWAGAPVDAAGDPLPWYTYPAIQFLQERVRPSMRVFEYGAGQSTHWWARHAAVVHAVEDDPTWFERVRADLPDEVDLRLAQGHAYVASIAERGERFDVVVIDGSDRTPCARRCLDQLCDDGVIVWDNTEEPNVFGEGLAHLRDAGFHRIDFHGLGPLNMDLWATSVLYRPGQNSFGL